MKKIILIDNYDSFTFNLYHYLSSLKVKVDVIRNDHITSDQILKRKYNKIVKSMYIVCLHPENRNNNYIMMKVPEMKKEVKLILKHLKNKISK